MISVAPNPVLLWILNKPLLFTIFQKTITINPLPIRYYGLVYALSFLFTYWYLVQLSKHKRIKLSVDQIETFLIYTILGTVIGGRVGEFIFYQTSTLLSNPLEVLKIWQGGMSFHGAIIGIIITTTLFCKKNNINFYTLSDHLVLPGALALFFGRIANFMNSELLGRITQNSWWCINWIEKDGPNVCRHPSQLYEAAKNLFMFGILYFMQYENWGTYRNKKYKPGYLTWLFVLMYGVLRAVVNIWREDTYTFLGFLSTGQTLSSLMAITALIVLYTQYWKNKE